MLAYDPSRTALYHPERSDTVFREAQSYSPVQLAVEAARLAYYRAEESSLETARLADALGRVGFGDLALFADPNTGAAAFAAHRADDATALLSFRGTQPDDARDLLTDLRASLVPWPESAGRVHRGFADALRALRPQIRRWLEGADSNSQRLIMTGHSLGAAMATLAATVWRPEWLVTLGSPRVGDAVFTATVAPTHCVRLVDCCDAVTEVPPEFTGYTHLNTQTYVTRDARCLENPAPSIVASDRFHARLDYSLRYAWKFSRNVLIRDLADHAPINYARAVFV